MRFATGARWPARACGRAWLPSVDRVRRSESHGTAITHSEVRTMNIGSPLSRTIARRLGGAIGVGAMTAALLATPQVTLASHGGGGGVTQAGTCSGSSTTKIKAKP